MTAINNTSFSNRIKAYAKHPFSLLLFLLVSLAALITFFVLISLVGYILVKGIPNITPSLFAWKYNSDNVSMMPSIINTLIITALSLLFSVPLGVFAAIYLTE
jgi:phosphate transport system permease protein